MSQIEPVVSRRLVAGPQRRVAMNGLRLIREAVFYTILCAGALVMLVPLVWMVSTAAKPLVDTTLPQFILIPSQFLLFQNVQAAFTSVPLSLFLRNSLMVSISVVAGELLVSSLAGYSFAKFSYPGRDVLFMLVLATMMIPFFVVVIPLYVVVYSFGWLDTYWGLIVPSLVSAFGIFLMRQWMLGIPAEILDSARIDGANEPHIYWVVVLPLSQPALASLAILAFLGSWDSYIWPLIVISKVSLMTIPLGLTFFQNEFGQVAWNQLMAASVIASLPTFLVFVIFQRQLMNGMVLSGLKG